VALVLAFVVLPFGRRVTDRAAAIDGQRDRVARLRAVLSHRSEIERAATERERELDRAGVRFIRERSPSLAAAGLQSLIQEYARASRVGITRLDVAGTPDSSGSATAVIPASVSATGDIYGLVELLGRLQRSPKLLELHELTVTSNSALRGNLLQATLLLRAPFVPGN
jgi:hypothetical protein